VNEKPLRLTITLTLSAWQEQSPGYWRIWWEYGEETQIAAMVCEEPKGRNGWTWRVWVPGKKDPVVHGSASSKEEAMESVDNAFQIVVHEARARAAA
jgi:hypothetical protein